jgi:RimJ/RimL family protein N-acetyltransferase
MMSHQVAAAAAAAQHAARLTAADDRRRRAEAGAARRGAGAVDVVLRDGSPVLIRPIGPGDAERLKDGFARLSPGSRRLRFLGPKKALSAAELRYFTEIDHRDHEALGAVSRVDGQGIGVARYVRSVEDPASAECAVTVVDAWHRRGLGTELLARLADRARAAGVHRFTGQVAHDNVAVLDLLAGVRAEVRLVRHDPQTLGFAVSLGARPGGGLVHPAARTLAT